MSEGVVARGVSARYGSHVAAPIVADLDLDLRPGRILGLAGESGSGKTTLALALTGYRSGRLTVDGEVHACEVDLASATTSRLRSVWGARLAYVPQDATTALNPARRVGVQLREALGRGAEDSDPVKRLERVGVPDPQGAMQRYPHQFSGGQRQRIALALTLAREPEVIILDEPTSGLDVTTQATINELIVSLVRESSAAVLYVSHDLAMLALLADELAVMYAGRVVEHGSAQDVFARPLHPYTRALVAAVPSIAQRRPLSGLSGRPPGHALFGSCGFADRCEHRGDECVSREPALVDVGARQVRCVRMEAVNASESPADDRSSVGRAPARGGELVLEGERLRCLFRSGRTEVAALDGASFALTRGSVLGIAGESGSGKSTLLRAVVGLVPYEGVVRAGGTPLPAGGKRDRAFRRDVQLVFQNPDASLNPRQRVRSIVRRPLELFEPEVGGREADHRVAAIVDQLGLPQATLGRFPGDLSGGQRQRVAIGRALIARPKVLLCDEITSALDVSVQATIAEILLSLRDQLGLSIIFVTHDLGLLRSVADEVLVMQQGQVVESHPADELYAEPRHPYTKALLAAVPDPRRAWSPASVRGC